MRLIFPPGLIFAPTFSGNILKITCTPYQLNLQYPFRLATGTRSHTDIVIVAITSGGHTGYGEASLPPYLSENTESVLRFISTVDRKYLKVIANLDEQLAYIDSVLPGNNAAKAALDLALHDLRGKTLGQNISQMYRIPQGKPIYSTYTIGISDEAALRQKLKAAEDFTLIKLKLGSPDDRALVETFLQYSDKPFCVDVNQGWTDRGYALEMAQFLEENNCLFIEQPFSAKNKENNAWLRARTKLDIVADEAVQRYSDLTEVAETYSGVNIKLMKSTGIHEALRMIKKSRELSLKIVVGCMAETSCAVTAAAHIASLADWADLDAPLLTTNDPFLGLEFNQGEVKIPQFSGIGIKLSSHFT